MVDTVESCSAGMRNSSELQCTEAPEFALAMRLQRQGNKHAETLDQTAAANEGWHSSDS